MIKATTILGIVMAAVTVASGDLLTLIEGRSLVGTVTLRGDTVQIETTEGILQFSSNQVIDIRYTEALEAQLTQMLQETHQNDPDAMFASGRWAIENGLLHQATEILKVVLRLDPDHPGAHQLLGDVRINKVWRTFDEAIAIARSMLDAGRYETLLRELLPKMEAVASEKKQLIPVRELRGHCQLRARDFAAASKTFDELAELAKQVQALRYAAIADILDENPRGTYVPTEAYPQGALFLGQGEYPYPSKPGTLADPIVLQIALHERATEYIETGYRLMTEAQTLESTDIDPAITRYDPDDYFYSMRILLVSK